jgi:hypothetical protein
MAKDNPLNRKGSSSTVIRDNKLVPIDNRLRIVNRPNAVVIGNKMINVANVKQPKYTFNEAMRLSQYGYTGLFGRGSKKTIGLLGENWQKAYALSRLRADNSVPVFNPEHIEERDRLMELAAADIMVPGTKAYNSTMELYERFASKYGADGSGFVKRYGGMPSKEGKYGLLFDLNNRKIKRDDVQATYQNNLAKELGSIAREFMAEDMPDERKAVGLRLLSLASDARLNSSRSKANPEKIKALESEFEWLGTTFAEEVQRELAATSERDDVPEFAGRTAMMALFGAVGGPTQSLGTNPVAREMANKAMGYMSGLADHDVLKSREVWWSSDKKPEGATWDSRGLIGLHNNWVRGFARFGLGLPTGVAMIAEEGVQAGAATKRRVTGEDEYWGQGYDFQIGDMIWADYANRFYDPFAYKVDRNGNYIMDENGEMIKQGFWSGVLNQDNYDAFGKQIAHDPLAYTLDLLDVAPIVGMAAKSASAAATVGRVPSYRGKAGLTRADKVALEKAQERLKTAQERAAVQPAASKRNAQEILERLEKDPEFYELVDQADIDAALRIMEPFDEAARAVSEVASLQRKFDLAPSPRNFRKIARAAINGDMQSMLAIQRWRAMGLEFNGAENSWTIRTSALFEPRTKVLDKPASVLEASDKAIIRLPASPIIRGIKESFYWIGRKTEEMAAKAIDDPDVSATKFKVATKWIDMPRLGYRWNYTKAIKSEEIDNWGDMTSEMYRASKLLRVNDAANLSAPMRQAVEAELFGGTGTLGPAAGPTVQRAALYDKIKSLPRDKNGNVLDIAQRDLALYQQRLNDLLDAEVAKVDEAAAARKFDEDFDLGRQDLRMRIADPDYKLGDPQLDAAVDLYRRMLRQDETIRRRLVHEDMTPQNLTHLRMLYTEAMTGLRLLGKDLFGKDGKSGRLGRYTGRVLRPNNAMGLYITRLIDPDDADQIINAAQSMDRVGTVFDGLDPATRKIREQQLVEAVEALVKDDAGIFRDGLGGSGEVGRPVLILARGTKNNPLEDVGPDFIQFHIPRLRHTLDNGRVQTGRLVDPDEVFVMPKVFFASKNKGAGKAILEDKTVGKSLLETGSLNAMADIYPNARFYSEKIAETGRQGVRMNERMVRTEHVVAESALREHDLAQAIRSQINYFINRIERDMASLAESQAVMVPAAQVVGKTAKESGYHILNNIRTFDSIEMARDFAKLRGVSDEFEAALKLYEDGTLMPVESTLDVSLGMGYRMMENGQPEFIVRGSVLDEAPYLIDENLERHTTLGAYRDLHYADATDIPDNGFVLAVPNQVDRQLAALAIEGDTFANRLLSNPMLFKSTNIFKWLVLNFNPKFISNNVLGGLTMLMIHNPSAGPKILFRAAQAIARKNGDSYMANVVREADAVNRQLKYEFEHNIYRKDSGVRQNTPESIRDLTNKHEWARKYVQNFGYTTVSSFEQFVRRNVAIDFLKQDPAVQAFMLSDNVKSYIDNGIDWEGAVRAGDDAITPFEAAVDLLLDRNSPFFDAQLKHRMRYTTNTVSGNYHRFGATEQFMRNFLMPFYAWQRHSATYSYRMIIDKPITTNVLYHIGQAGYVETASQGVPDWMMMTVPMPETIKEMMGMEDEDFRIDLNMLSPFATTGDMAAAAVKLLTGTDMGASVFEFTNPYVNMIIKDTLGVNPQTGAWDFSGEQQGKGFINALYDTAKSIGKGTYLGRGKSVVDAVTNEYDKDALSNKYATVKHAPDILKNYEEGKEMSQWSLSVPNMRKTEDLKGNTPAAVLAMMGIVGYKVNLDAMSEKDRAEAVGAYVLNRANHSKMVERAERDVNSVKEWQRRRDYVMQVWLPAARQQNVSEDVIMLVLAKIEQEKPKGKNRSELLGLMGG